MNYIQGLADQTEIFLYALGFGFLLGILYNLVKALRMINPGAKGFVFFLDMLYFVVCTFLVFCFVMVTDSGNLRIYVVFGIALGWTVCYFSFGMIFSKAVGTIIGFIRAVFAAVFRWSDRLILSKLRKKRKNEDFCKKNARKINKKAKFNLQKYRDIVYNLLGYNENKKIVEKGND